MHKSYNISGSNKVVHIVGESNYKFVIYIQKEQAVLFYSRNAEINRGYFCYAPIFAEKFSCFSDAMEVLETLGLERSMAQIGVYHEETKENA